MFTNLIRRAGGAAVIAVGLAVATTSVASAHECYIASRSAQGNAMAGSNSQAWYTLVVADAIQGDVTAGRITQTQANCIKSAYAATGAPSSFTIHVKGVTGQDGVLAAHNPNDALMTNGKGVDHAFDAYGAQIFGSYAQCGVSF
ncbi:hypothetical protein [Raineyella fluvialis]|uniref:Uncharacterized protein n=1 Tax=Raineyella fluvialis TaxID=2662261 RepID=A0A5Q2FIC1_9ACTN|nr:hypothetical protein [Raineyella fluvialis]QGF24106.1 hypothetical protein Rai3103_10920 [Raineyella fluvialis]